MRVIVFGATGVVGRAAAEHFAGLPDCDVIAVSRRSVDVEGVRHISLDPADASAANSALASDACAGVTHVVYAALQESSDLAGGWRDRELMDYNLKLFENSLRPLANASGSTLRHVSLLQGAKAYGLHAGGARCRLRNEHHPTSTRTSTSCKRTPCGPSPMAPTGRGPSCDRKSSSVSRWAAR